MTALAKIHVAKKQLGLDEDTYRAVLVRAGGQASAKGMSEAQLGRVLEEFKRLGFKPAPPLSGKPLAGPRATLKASSNGRRKALEGKFAPKLQALWIAGWNLGIVRNRDDKALLAFVKRQTGLDHTRFLHHAEDAAKAIEAIKKWLTRDGGVDWTVRNFEPLHKQMSGFRIALAQFVRMHPEMSSGAVYTAFVGEALAISGKPVHFMATEADWHPVMNEFGKRIRAAGEAD